MTWRWARPSPEGIADRVVHNDYTARWHGREAEVLDHQQELREQVQAAEAAGDARIAAVRAGNAAGLIHAVEPAAEIVRRIVAEAEDLLRVRPSQVLR